MPPAPDFQKPAARVLPQSCDGGAVHGACLVRTGVPRCTAAAFARYRDSNRRRIECLNGFHVHNDDGPAHIQVHHPQNPRRAPNQPRECLHANVEVPSLSNAPQMPDAYALPGHIPQDAVDQLARCPRIERLSIARTPLLTVRLAQRIEPLRAEEVWMWCPVTPAAMRHVLRMPELRVLDVLRITQAGKLPSFAGAGRLEVLRANHGLSARDLTQVASSPTLRELGAQHAHVTDASVDALLAMPALASLDLECSPFDDAMARRVSRSTRITALDVGATCLTRRGLAQLVEMQQLRALDLWQTRIDADDLQLLWRLPQLEYLSLGPGGGPALDVGKVVSVLLELPALKRVWLDGLRIEPAQRVLLESKFESARITEY